MRMVITVRSQRRHALILHSHTAARCNACIACSALYHQTWHVGQDMYGCPGRFQTGMQIVPAGACAAVSFAHNVGAASGQSSVLRCPTAAWTSTL